MKVIAIQRMGVHKIEMENKKRKSKQEIHTFTYYFTFYFKKLLNILCCK